MRRRCVDSDEIARKVLQRFLETAEGTIDQLELALTENQTEVACRHAHSLKGASATVSADAVSRKAAEIERLLRNGAQAAAASGLLPLRLETVQCLHRIRAILAQPAARR